MCVYSSNCCDGMNENDCDDRNFFVEEMPREKINRWVFARIYVEMYVLW
jgi:hypothetical protein